MWPEPPYPGHLVGLLGPNVCINTVFLRVYTMCCSSGRGECIDVFLVGVTKYEEAGEGLAMLD